MVSGMPLETCWAFNKIWNNKFYYKVASCWLFPLIHTTMHGSMSVKFKLFLALNVARFNPLVLLIRFSIETKASMEYWWSDIGRGKHKYWEKNLYCWHFVYRKSNIDRPGKLNPGPCGKRPAANRLTCGDTGLTNITVANKYRQMHTYRRTPLIRLNTLRAGDADLRF